MKKLVSIILLYFIISSSFAGCGNQSVVQEETSQTIAIGNPWTKCNSIGEAEAATGFSFGLPDVIADSYEAVSIRIMNNELIEVIYRDDSFEVCVRKQKGAGQDISGDYNEYENCIEMNQNGAAVISCYNSNNTAVKQTISYDGYSWSLVAPNGYWGDSNRDFLNGILNT